MPLWTLHSVGNTTNKQVKCVSGHGKYRENDEARQGDMNWMGASIPEMLTFESKPEGSEEVSHAYKVDRLGDLLIMAEAERPRLDGAAVRQEWEGA